MAFAGKSKLPAPQNVPDAATGETEIQPSPTRRTAGSRPWPPRPPPTDGGGRRRKTAEGARHRAATQPPEPPLSIPAYRREDVCRTATSRHSSTDPRDPSHAGTLSSPADGPNTTTPT
ncbi:hypothetical protein U9M48_032506 [Paspalum notatum var. saurae]|uniref:Uncharacterized protein n=1 Tax=Paspalum notatum var. saurae TaxID=547442 RepID=A0AAQ3U7F2_PASNO